MIIVTYNPPTDGLETSYLNSSLAAGVTTLPVKNANNFVNGQKILVGAMGRERSEIVTITGSPTPTTLPTTTTLFPHDADDPIIALEFDQVRIYRSTTGVNGSYSLLTAINLDVDNIDGKTYYDDITGMPTYYYQTCYYDSVGSDESQRTDPIAATGFTPKQVGRVIATVAREVGDKDFIYYSPEDYFAWINDINDELLMNARRPYSFLKISATLDVSEGDSSVPLPLNYWKNNYYEVNTTTPALRSVMQPKQVDLTTARNRLAYNLNSGQYVTGTAIDDENREIIFYPAAANDVIGLFALHYYRYFPEVKSMSDLLLTPGIAVYKYGLKMKIYAIKADDDSKYLAQMQQNEKLYGAEVIKLQREKNINAAGTSGMRPDRHGYSQHGPRRYRQ